jgi:hypothetical protein
MTSGRLRPLVATRRILSEESRRAGEEEAGANRRMLKIGIEEEQGEGAATARGGASRPLRSLLLKRPNQQVDEDRQEDRQQKRDDEAARRATVGANAAAAVAPAAEEVAEQAANLARSR